MKWYIWRQHRNISDVRIGCIIDIYIHIYTILDISRKKLFCTYIHTHKYTFYHLEEVWTDSHQMHKRGLLGRKCGLAMRAKDECCYVDEMMNFHDNQLICYLYNLKIRKIALFCTILIFTFFFYKF